jgi:cardiolipin synthase A/B
MGRDATTGRRALAAVALVGVPVLIELYRRVLAIPQRPSWPPPRHAVTSAGAQAATEARAHGGVLDFAWSTAATIEPWVEGANFFPRIFADVETATSSVHILMFGWREGAVGTQMADLLKRKLAEGAEVRVIVDGFGSRPYAAAREMFTGLAAAGAEIVVNDFSPFERRGLFPDRQRRAVRQGELGRVDHRKLYVVDGTVAWTGGAGLEDHFENGAFHDVMVRVTGDVVRQAQAAFLSSFQGHGGPLPTDLAGLFPEQPDPGTTPIALAEVIPGGLVAATQAIREQIDQATERLDIANAYLTDHDAIARVIEASRRGAKVRLLVSETSNNAQASAALRHRYAELAAAGVEVWELPNTVVHAKVVVADDLVSFGTVNLDAWALYRNSEIMMIARSPELAELFEERMFEPDIARAKRAAPPSGNRERLECWLWDKLTFLL